MRFTENGPWLPDTLLTARDEGRVVFFCGAGVSQAGAGLPNFETLAGCVLDALGSSIVSPARRLFESGGRFASDSGLPGIVATDRIFALLEQEFDPREVREAVAVALRPAPEASLGAHRTMLDLARDRTGVVRLVTTNFDRLFEACEPTLESHNPPRLPDPARATDFRGIVHIHGRVDADYRAACDDEFVLSSADFGRAYLSDGWATRYIRSLLQRYAIVFVGYSADDPPVQYLLEALDRAGERRNELYAFQAGDVTQATAHWAHKGVRPIPYDPADRHLALWDTLRAWADRARDVDAWYERVATMAAGGPAPLRPFQRGIVAHLAATREGAHRLAAAHDPLPAEWLRVLDPRQRHAAPERIDPHMGDSARHDPFEWLGLDSDGMPDPIDPEDWAPRREVPSDAWDLLAASEGDREEFPSEDMGTLRGGGAMHPSRLPVRLQHLGMYLARVAHQPSALWWAAHQKGLHPQIVNQVRSRMRGNEVPEAVRTGWQLLFASWSERRPDPDQTRYETRTRVARDGWSTSVVRAAMEAYRPILTVVPARVGPTAEDGNDLPLERMVRPDVHYPRPHGRILVPPEHLEYAISIFRGHMEHGVALEREIGGSGAMYLDPRLAADGETLDEGAYQLAGHFATFANMVSRLAANDAAAARAEVFRWMRRGDQVFERLRIWAAGRPALLSGAEAADVLLDLDDGTFWAGRRAREILHVLRDRWNDMPQDARNRIEHRLLNGRLTFPEPDDEPAWIQAHRRLDRLRWLGDNGVGFSFDLDATISAERIVAPDWMPEHAADVARPNVVGIRALATDVDPGPFASLPLGEVLQAVRQNTGFDFGAGVERRPFSGLVDMRPARALAVITNARRRNEFAEAEWSVVLRATSGGEHSSRLLRAIAGRLSRLEVDQIASLGHPISEWLRELGPRLLDDLPDVFDSTWDGLRNALANCPPPERVRRVGAGWADDALNAPAGRLVDALLRDPTASGFRSGDGLPSSWRTRLDGMLELPGDARRHAITMVAHHMNWFFDIDPTWTEARLLPLAEDRGMDGQAFWDGYFWAGETPQPILYSRLKPSLLALTRFASLGRRDAAVLAAMLLSGSTLVSEGDAQVSDLDLRETLIHGGDEIRIHMLWHLKRWGETAAPPRPERIIAFLRDAWPRQTAVRTPRTTATLVELALDSPQMFPELVEVILPKLGTMTDGRLSDIGYLDVDDIIVERHPERLLDLLWNILPEDPRRWPDGTLAVLDTLGGRGAVRQDRRMIELMRRSAGR